MYIHNYYITIRALLNLSVHETMKVLIKLISVYKIRSYVAIC